MMWLKCQCEGKGRAVITDLTILEAKRKEALNHKPGI